MSCWVILLVWLFTVQGRSKTTSGHGCRLFKGLVYALVNEKMLVKDIGEFEKAIRIVHLTKTRFGLCEACAFGRESGCVVHFICFFGF